VTFIVSGPPNGDRTLFHAVKLLRSIARLPRPTWALRQTGKSLQCSITQAASMCVPDHRWRHHVPMVMSTICACLETAMLLAGRLLLQQDSTHLASSVQRWWPRPWHPDTPESHRLPDKIPALLPYTVGGDAGSRPTDPAPYM
jgi:hypothetical protein